MAKRTKAEWLAKINEWKITGKRVCTKCGEEKAIDSFHSDGKRFKWRCKSCAYQVSRIWRTANKERHADKQNWNRMKRRFGISESEYNGLLSEQRGGCALCGGKNGERRLAVDHCHQTGAVRGLLCLGCNTALGHMGDSLPLLQKAMEYLRKHGASWGG